jgi:hypothetical protein
VLVTRGRSLAFLVEQARQAADLKLAVEEKIPARHHQVAFVQPAEHRIRIVGPRTGLDLDRDELALGLLDIDELTNAAVEEAVIGTDSGS